MPAPYPRIPLREIRQKLLDVLDGGFVKYSTHALQRLDQREIHTVDVENLLARGQIREPEQDAEGRWCYKPETDRMYIVIVFIDAETILVKTAVRKSR